MLPIPFIGTILGSVTGGLVGSILASSAMDVVLGDKKLSDYLAIANMQASMKTVGKPRIIDKRIKDIDQLLAEKKKELLIGGQGPLAPNPNMVLKQIESLEEEKGKLISERGALEQDMIIVTADTVIAPTSIVDSSVDSTTVYVDNNTAAGMGPNPHKY